MIFPGLFICFWRGRKNRGKWDAISQHASKGKKVTDGGTKEEVRGRNQGVNGPSRL